MIAIEITVALILIAVIFLKPYLGIIIIASSLPVVDLLPEIPYFTSVVPIVGGVTLVAYVLHWSRGVGKPLVHFRSVHIVGLLFIIWVFISNPEAALFGTDRNWIFTLLQLWILICLAGELMDTPYRHQVFMWIFAISSTLSAFLAIQNGRIGDNIYMSARSAGLAEGANAAGRYFVVAFVFLNFLQIITKKRFMRLLLLVSMGVTFLGVFFTVSRTSILLLFIAIGFMIILHTKIKYQIQIIIFFVIVMAGLWLYSDSLEKILSSIFPSITQGTDTIGLRYRLWDAGWHMWLDHPIVGVGIGRYPGQLINYSQAGTIPIFYLIPGLVTHNMYIQVLAETGFLGFGLFVLLLAITLKNIWTSNNGSDPKFRFLRNAWAVVFLVMLVGGITKSDQADKLIWVTVGISSFFQAQNIFINQETVPVEMVNKTTQKASSIQKNG